MSRASSAPLAASSIPPTIQALAQQAGVQLTPTQLRLLEKQQEHAGLQALKEASGNLLEKVEELARMGNVMADGGEGELHWHPFMQTSALIWLECSRWIRVEELAASVFHFESLRWVQTFRFRDTPTLMLILRLFRPFRRTSRPGVDIYQSRRPRCCAHRAVGRGSACRAGKAAATAGPPAVRQRRVVIGRCQVPRDTIGRSPAAAVGNWGNRITSLPPSHIGSRESAASNLMIQRIFRRRAITVWTTSC